MNEELSPSDRAQQLREQAEAKLKALDAHMQGAKSPEQIRQLVHELQVHQVELELQQEELYQSNDALKASEARYRHLYQFAPNGYFTLNAQGGIEEANFAAARLLGIDRRVMVGNLFRKYISASYRTDFDEFFSNLQYMQDAQHCEVLLITPRGEERIVILEAAILGEEPAKQMSYLITAIDIIGRKKTELEVQAQQHLLQTVMEAVMTGVAVFESVRNGQGEIVDFVYRLANKGVSNIAGRNLVGLRYLELYPGVKITGIFDKMKRVVETGQPIDFEQDYQEEGFTHWFRITAVKLGDGIVSTVEDITGRKRLEQENLQMRLEGQKTLLQAILHAQEEERRRISESLHNGVGQLLYAIQLNLEQLTSNAPSTPLFQAAIQQAQQLLKEAIRETRTVSHELIPLLLQEEGLDAAIGDFCNRFNRSGISISGYAPKERLDPPLEMAVYRICQELVNNMVKHSGAGRGRIEVINEKDSIIVEAQDNGKGIDLGEQSKGIGLKTIKDRVRLLEGTVTIDSEPGKGTLITIRLPLKKRE